MILLLKVGKQYAHLVVRDSGNGVAIQASIEAAQQHKLNAMMMGEEGHERLVNDGFI